MSATMREKTAEQRIMDFANACYDQNSRAELLAALKAPRADRDDCREWGLTATQWRDAINRAISWAIRNEVQS